MTFCSCVSLETTPPELEVHESFKRTFSLSTFKMFPNTDEEKARDGRRGGREEERVGREKRTLGAGQRKARSFKYPDPLVVNISNLHICFQFVPTWMCWHACIYAGMTTHRYYFQQLNSMKSPQTLNWEVSNNSLLQKKAHQQMDFLWATVLSSYFNQSKWSLASLCVCLNPPYSVLATDGHWACSQQHCNLSWSLSNTHVLHIRFNRVRQAWGILDRTIFITLEGHLNNKNTKKITYVRSMGCTERREHLFTRESQGRTKCHLVGPRRECAYQWLTLSTPLHILQMTNKAPWGPRVPNRRPWVAKFQSTESMENEVWLYIWII